MLRSRKLRVALATVGVLGGGTAIVAIPTASAEQCTVTVTVVGGQTYTFTVDVPPGTPLSSLSLPVKAPVAGITESCATPSAAPQPAPTTGTPTTPAPAAPQPAPKSTGPGNAQKPSVNKHAKPLTRKHGAAPKGGTTVTGPASTTTAPKKNTPPALRGSGGVPSPSNPTFAFALPGPAPLGVPNFFIDSFRIPPFLLPIYQAAGIEYDVPWQVLAGINEIETDYGRNLSISSAGAVGWMQFLPGTWKTYGIDANGDGVADPYNPVDAIFSAARYLHAAGASKNIGQAIFAYNHAGWYVQSVLLRAKLIGGMPDQLTDALTGLVEGHFPVAAPARYADDSVERLATRRIKSANAAIPIDSTPGSKGVSIFANQGSPVIAVNDGKIVRIGQNSKWGKFVQLQDQTGNIYTYANLGSIPKTYPVPRPVRITAAQIAKELSSTPAPKPTGPATAGQQVQISGLTPSKVVKPAKAAKPRVKLQTSDQVASSVPPVAQVKERLFAHPSRPASFAAGGAQQVQAEQAKITSFRNYFSDVLHLGRNQYTLKALKAGSIVVAGTILGRIGGPSATTAPHVLFMIQPAGRNAPQIDPKPILDGWKLLEATAVYRAAGRNPFFGPGAKNPSIGQVLLMSKEQLAQRVLSDPHVQVYSCGRRDIQAGTIDRRVLGTIEFLAASGLDPTVSGLACGAQLAATSGTDAAGATGSSMDISAINGIPIQGHQGAGSITDIAIRRLLTLQGTFRPDQIISLMSYKGQNNTLALPDHANRVQVTYTPLFGQNKKLSAQITSILKPGQWVKLINRISQIPEPTVPVTPSQYAIRTGQGG